ncbi:MAG TPA: N-acetylmuramoyl-L-alanine amidase [Flavisolibacter sp.]|nr:N-acetylmuramoyl-L-alanine amidase [Flavisolibacter sp.]
MLKNILLTASFLIITTLFISFSQPEKQKAIKTIIIDAGHGIMSNGGYNGAKGSYSYEDEICYAVAKELVQSIRSRFPEVNIIETRPNRTITELHQRADIANHNKGDLFISIHVNAAPPQQHKEFTGNKTVVSYTGKGKKRKKVTRQVPQYRYYTTPNPAKGTETYIWGSHRNEDKEVAMRENAPMLSEENYKEKYGDIDPNSPQFIALSLLKTKQFFKRSATLAGMVEEQFIKAGRTSRGQKQRGVGIWVLQATAMPSILVETGYITNKAEEDYLNSQAGQAQIAGCVTSAVQEYIDWLTKQQGASNVKASSNPSSNTSAFTFLQGIEEAEIKQKHFTK